MKRRDLAILSLCAVSALTFATEDELEFSAGLDLNYKILKFENSFGSYAQSTETPIWTFGLSPSIRYGRIFASVSAERSIGSGNTTIVTHSPSSSLTHWTTWRAENSVTVGYNVLGNASIFIGHLNSKTERQSVLYSSVGDSANFYTYVEKGPYYGAAYSHEVGSRGSVSASLAYLNGKGTSENSTANYTQNLSGTVQGRSLGVSWTQKLSSDLFAKLGYRATRYSFQNVGPTGVSTKTKQDYDTIGLSLVKPF